MAPPHKAKKGPRPPGTKGKLGGFNPGNVNNIRSTYKGKAGKIKADLIHKAKVKKHYFSELAKQDQEEDTPDFYKEIFAQVDEQQKEEKKERDERMAMRDALDKEAKGEGDNSGSDTEATGSGMDCGPTHDASSSSSIKPNPYQRAQSILEQQDRERAAMFETLRKEKEAREKAKAQSRKEREQTKVRLSKRTRKGQPVLSNLDIQRGISRWSHLLLLSLLFGIGLAFFVTHAILLLVDPPMSFWSRELIRSLAYLFLFTGPVPHVIHLVSLVGRTDMDTIHYGLTKRSTQVLAYTIPLVLAVGGSLSVIAYWEIDLGNPVAYRWFYTSACILYLYPCVVILWFYQAYGIRFADIIDAHLEESGSRSVRRARSMGMMKHLDPFPDRTAVVSYSLQKVLPMRQE
ncbi:hypothetical protein BJ684DRAFT_18845 [Piptocephalis cylindrospora]|uniref:rRNA-processing protein FYV7 n=1 Tax=Piptocephalis cylindrospora TaxID=1907219 RepID=A0A4P9Y6Z9_9FUNG|nr:hypothetical protein BJ684DRAFT_18845 [Piptocephalis cylindrospora]|eukprot:RKP14763.1 hypothetical protein BJ684DRAFT_18845 [Piptocephalis cylindrospora]